MSANRNEVLTGRATLEERADAISKILVDARLSASPLSDFPERLPDTLEEAYAIQAASMGRWPDELAGWKVAMMPLPDRERFTAQRLVGPVFRPYVYKADTEQRNVVPIFDGGFAAIEAEFVFILGKSVPPASRDHSDEELIDVIAAMHCGAEIASSPMAVANERGATSIVSDFGCNAGVLVGPEIPDWSSRALDSMPVSVTVDDEVVGDATAAAVPGGPLQAFRFLVEHCAARGVELPARTVVSSGAVTGVHSVKTDSIAHVDFGPFGRFEVAFQPMTARQ